MHEMVVLLFNWCDITKWRVLTAHWVGDCFIYTNANNRLNYCVGSEVVTVSHLDRYDITNQTKLLFRHFWPTFDTRDTFPREMYLLGYIPQINRLFLIDKSLQIVSYALHMSIINYQTAVLRGDHKAAAEILPKIPVEHRNRIAQFLDSQGFKEGENSDMRNSQNAKPFFFSHFKIKFSHFFILFYFFELDCSGSWGFEWFWSQVRTCYSIAKVGYCSQNCTRFLIWFDLIWFDLIRFDLIWFICWFDSIWFDLIWLI